MKYLHKIGTVVKVPCRNYDGWTYAIIESVHSNGLVAVRALKGSPWNEYTHGGWSSTAYQTFYPDVVDAKLTQHDISFIESREQGFSISKQLFDYELGAPR